MPAKRKKVASHGTELPPILHQLKGMIKTDDNAISKGNVGESNNSMQKPDELDTRKESCPSTKRKIENEDQKKSAISAKKLKADNEMSPQSFSPRRSGRGVVPNRKYKDMEVEIIPNRRKSLKSAETPSKSIKEKLADPKKKHIKNVEKEPINQTMQSVEKHGLEDKELQVGNTLTDSDNCIQEVATANQDKPQERDGGMTTESLANKGENSVSQTETRSDNSQPDSCDIVPRVFKTLKNDVVEKEPAISSVDNSFENIVHKRCTSAGTADSFVNQNEKCENDQMIQTDLGPSSFQVFPEEGKESSSAVSNPSPHSKTSEFKKNDGIEKEQEETKTSSAVDKEKEIENKSISKRFSEAETTCDTCTDTESESAQQSDQKTELNTMEETSCSSQNEPEITLITKEDDSSQATLDIPKLDVPVQEDVKDSLSLKVKCLSRSEQAESEQMEIELVSLNDSDIHEISSEEISYIVEEQLKTKNESLEFSKGSSNEIKVKIACTREDSEASKVITIQGDKSNNAAHVPVISSRVADIPGKPKTSTSEKIVIKDISYVTKTTSTDVAVLDGKAVTNRRQEYVIVTLPNDLEVTRRTVERWTEAPRVPFEQREDGEFVCGMCDYKTYKKTNWYKHKKTHLPKKEYACQHCTYVARTSSNLKRHLAIHDDIRQFQCHVCHLMFRQKIHLMRHIKYRHEEKKVECSLCDYVCANENPDLKVHMLRRHCPPGSTEVGAGFPCEECGIISMSKKDLKQHMKFHKKGPELKLFCEHCSFVTDCESRLKRHLLTHSNEKPYMCGSCDYRASQKEHVLRHLRTQHNMDIRPKPTTKTHVDENSNTESTDSKEEVSSKGDKTDYSSMEKIFACNHCPMKFAKLLNLYKHLHAQHKNVLPSQSSDEYLCVVCDFRTSSRKNLLVHMRKHNIHDHSPPSHVYSCVLCRYMNPRRKNLFLHMKKKHNIEIIVKEDGTSSCYVLEGNGSEFNDIMANLTAKEKSTFDETQLRIITDEDFIAKGGLQIQNIISMEELASAISKPMPVHQHWKKSSESREEDSSDAVDIEGLKTLAEQAERNSALLRDMDSSQEIVDEMETEIITMDTTTTDIIEGRGDKPSITVTAEDVMDLSSGDYVQIDGEMYKIEISDDQKIGLPGRIETVIGTDETTSEREPQLITIEPGSSEVVDFPLLISKENVGLSSKGEDNIHANEIISQSKETASVMHVNVGNLFQVNSTAFNPHIVMEENTASPQVASSHSIPGVNDVEISNESQVVMTMKPSTTTREPFVHSVVNADIIQSIPEVHVSSENSVSKPYIVLESNAGQTSHLESVSEQVQLSETGGDCYEYHVLHPGPDGKININNHGKTEEYVLLDVSSSDSASILTS